MAPAFWPPEKLFIQIPGESKVKRLDIVSFRVDGKEQVARIIALPGEAIRITDEKVAIDGAPILTKNSTKKNVKRAG